MRKRSIVWIAGGAAGAVAALVASPGTYAWLRRTIGGASDRHHYETEPEFGLDQEIASDDPTDDLRLSLRARLAESAATEDVDAISRANARAAADGGTIDRPDLDPVDDARQRVRAKAKAAKARLTEDAAPSDVAE